MSQQVKNYRIATFIHKYKLFLIGKTDENVLKQYYRDAYSRIRAFSDCLLSISPLLYQQGPGDSDWSSFMPSPQYNNVRHEWHRYQIWGYEVSIYSLV